MTKFDLARFKEVCQAHRETYDPEYWMSFRQSLLVDLKEEFCNWGERPAAPATSFEAIREHLSMARHGLMQFAATDAQIDFIARLAVEQGLAASQICGTSGLTKGEASAIINHMKKG